MIRGLNTNIKRNGRIYHIQTEDSGVKSAFITAHLFLDGAVLAAVRTDYSDIAELPEEPLVVEVAERMRKAHRQMINRLTSGDFDEKKKSAQATAIKTESVVLTDDSAVLEDDDELVPAEDKTQENPDGIVSAADFQALLEYDDEDDEDNDAENTISEKPSAQKALETPAVDKSDDKLLEHEAQKPEKSQAGMSRTERIAAILARFDETSPAADFSVSARIRKLLDGEEA